MDMSAAPARKGEARKTLKNALLCQPNSGATAFVITGE
jgi:hypothetical protein